MHLKQWLAAGEAIVLFHDDLSNMCLTKMILHEEIQCSRVHTCMYTQMYNACRLLLFLFQHRLAIIV